MSQTAIFYQLFEHESSTYTYLIADPISREAAIIDPVHETVDRDLQLAEDLGLKIKYALDTHVHADHVTGSGEIRRRTGAKTGLAGASGVDCADLELVDGQELHLGKLTIKALATPGHTDSCMSFYCDGRVFTGDALLIRGTGRTDFQQGSSDRLYDSVVNKLFTLPDNTQVYPGHDYRGQTASTIGLEKKLNPRLGGGRSKQEFIRTMAELKLAHPKKIHEALPANMACGMIASKRALEPTVNDGIPEISVKQLHECMGKVRIIDVREVDEFNNELGHINGAELIPLGPQLTAFLEKGDRKQEIAFVCRSGGRSGRATLESRALGYNLTANMVGGMIHWNEVRLPVERR